MIWFSSDTHYHHNNVIRFCSRPFQSVEEMNEILIHRWNSLVKQEDSVYFLGDFSLAFRPIETISQRLLGKKFFVAGNHDFIHSYNKKSRTPENRAKWIQKYQEYGWEILPEQTTLDVPGLATFNLCHLTYKNMNNKDTTQQYDDKYTNWRPQNDGKVLLCGHTHEKTGKINGGINVGVDVWNGYPVSIDQIAKLVADPREIIPPPKWGQTLLDI